MRQFLSNISSQIYSRKKIILCGLALALFFSFVPVQFAQANIFSDIFGTITNLFIGWQWGIPIAIVTAILYGLALIAAWLGVVLLAILKIFLVASVSFPLLPGHSIEVVNIGWEFSRNLVNIVFILILVFIGLATILRIQNYQLQKTLPSLIIMALLVNFSGVFVAFIVDIANIFTNAFVAKLGTLTMGVQASKELFESLIQGFIGLLTNITDVGAIIIPAVKGAVYLGFYAIFALIMFVVTLLMLVRVGILCALTILAPIAFAARILPATKNIWDQWLKQLIQWAIIGIPITFFLWLAQTAATGATDIKSKFMVGFNPTKLGGADLGVVNIIMDLTGPLIALLLVAIGVMVSMQMAPAGAQGIINMGKKAGMGATKWAGQKAWKATRDRIPEGARKAMERMATGENPTWGKGKAGLGGLLQRSAAGVAGYTRRTTGGIAKSAVIGSEQADAEKAKAKASKQDVISNMKDLRQTASVAERTAIMDAMRQKNQIKDALDPDITGKENMLKQNEVTDIYQKAHRTRNTDLVEGLERAYANKPETLAEFASITDEITKNSFDVNDRTGLLAGTYTGGDGKPVTLAADRASGLGRRDVEERGYASFADKIIGEAKTADEIKALQKYWWNNDDLMNAAHKFWAGNQTSQAATVFGRDFVNRLEATKKDASWYFELEQRKGSDGKVAHVPRNVAMPRYLSGTTAQALGIAPLENATNTTQVNDMTRLANAWAPHFSRLKNQYGELQAILQDRGELEIMRRVPNTEQAQDTLQQIIQARRTNLRNEITTLLGQHPELKTVLARTEEFLDKKKGGGRGGQQPSTGSAGPTPPGTPPQQPTGGRGRSRRQNP